MVSGSTTASEDRNPDRWMRVEGSSGPLAAVFVSSSRPSPSEFRLAQKALLLGFLQDEAETQGVEAVRDQLRLFLNRSPEDGAAAPDLSSVDPSQFLELVANSSQWMSAEGTPPKDQLVPLGPAEISEIEEMTLGELLEAVSLKALEG